MKTNTIYGSFAEQVKQYPNKTAVFDETDKFTYRQLDESADIIASHFPSEAAFIGIIMDHGVNMIASILAILKTNAAYVPAEPDFPTERIRFMMEECNVGFIITQKKYAGKLSGFPLFFIEDIMADGTAQYAVSDKSTPESVAYVLYTSGSTGVPKGVVVENRNVCHYVRAFQNEFHPSVDDIMLQYSVCSFDIFVEEVFATLLSGATLAIPSAETKQNLTALMVFAEKNSITIISGFPYLLMDMNRLETIPGSIRLLISGGDVLRESYVSNLLLQTEIYNTYGPSETTVCTTYYHCNGQNALTDGTYPIGQAVQGSVVVLLDEGLNPVKPGETGEICIAGGGVSRGYLDAGKNEMFVTMPDGVRLYRSGDLGHLLPDGNIVFLRRKDTQVMILGKRVEPKEVENVLCRCKGVKTGLVCSGTGKNGFSYLVAYIVPGSSNFSLSDVKDEMSLYLTPFMIPEYFVLLNHIPLTPNGKPDFAELPAVLKTGGC